MSPSRGSTTALDEPPRLPRAAGASGSRTLAEKVGQLNQITAPATITADLEGAVAAGTVGSILNEVDVETVNALQRVAVEESRLGIPLLFGRDVIHGFKTVFPIPLAQAASFDEDLVRACARVAAHEAAAAGVRWTFAPMVDIGRDPRWGRVAECLGEDPWLSGSLARAMVEGFQGEALSDPGSLARSTSPATGPAKRAGITTTPGFRSWSFGTSTCPRSGPPWRRGWPPSWPPSAI